MHIYVYIHMYIYVYIHYFIKIVATQNLLQCAYYFSYNNAAILLNRKIRSHEIYTNYKQISLSPFHKKVILQLMEF